MACREEARVKRIIQYTIETRNFVADGKPTVVIDRKSDVDRAPEWLKYCCTQIWNYL
jgi:hypothetical protein